MKKIIFLVWLGVMSIHCPLLSQVVHIKYSEANAQINYATKVLSKSLVSRGYTIGAHKAEVTIHLLVNARDLGPEEYRIQPNGAMVSLEGGDGRGVIYACMELSEQLMNGTSLLQLKGKTERPRLAFRAIKFDLPWDTYRHSYSLDQHQETCSDLNYWEAFLDMMVENRFNTLTLWNLHPYPFMIRPRNFPEACFFNDAELRKWQELFHGIFRMASERGIDTYMVPFNIFVSPTFAKAHNVATDNLEHHFFVKGDTSEIIKRYTRECVTQILQEYPDLTGMGLTLGEGMAGMTPQERENWMKETIIEGMRLANRKSKLIHRIPFSGNTASLGATSIEMEQITRKGIEKEAAMEFIEGPVWADLKFNWSHAHSTPKLIKVHGGKLYGTYFYPQPQGYKIIWTARNEDFFCLRWGVPDFIRAHIAANTPEYVGGYMVGSETYIPAKDYFTKPGIAVSWKYAFQRQWLFYKLWGRLLYNPETSDAVFSQEFARKYGKGKEKLLEAYALASRTPLRLASAFDCGWDFTLYSEGFMALDPAVKRVNFITVDRLINQSPLDSTYLSVSEYVRTLENGGIIDASRITPPVLAGMLENDCLKALEIVQHIDVKGNNDLFQEIADIKAWANLGLYFAEKLRGAVALQTYRIKGSDNQKQQAIQHLTQALKYWDAVIAITQPLYNEMPLVHLSEQDGKPWQENDHLRFHWSILRPDVVKDIDVAAGSGRGQ
jgi:hypothetical protein